MAREKKKVLVNISREMAEDAMGSFAKAANHLQKIEAEMNAKIAAIREKYQDKVTELGELKTDMVEVLETYATETFEQWGKRKSCELLHGVIGYRTGTPKIKFDKGFNSKSVTAILEEQFPQYVRTVTELNKEQLIADREEEFFAAIAKKAHVLVVQEESFYVESKSEELQDA